ncbi:MAG: alpha-L-arabinofuranosidase C-terminal domain-containing protein [Actinomycetota bacterium]|nr:alpha-L-arabinofuranosidase C-terminal domain-containing protein [Actinomycetota bacterium]
MTDARFHLHPHQHVGAVDERIFGGFLEHMGRAVYEGVFDPDSAHADEHGCRTDVLGALGDLDFTVMRYPGGNFVSNYHWRDGIGPLADRPVRRDLAWGTIEPNLFGTHEFLALAERMNWSPMFAVNLGTGSPEEAADWVEYCNADNGTAIVEERASNQRDQPWGVPLWCLGNEMDGPWQVGHMPAHEYGVKARQAAHMMKLVDSAIELVVCGTSIPTNPTYLEWDRTALEAVGGLADMLSTHRYVDNWADDTRSYLTTGASIDRQISETDAVCRYVAGRRGRIRRPYIAFDEWNVWFRTRNAEGMQRGGAFPMPLVEEVYDLQDALVVAQFLISFIRNADVVKVANLAQIVNVIGPLLTKGDDLLRQTIYESLAMFVSRRTGVSLRVGYEGPMTSAPEIGDIPEVDGAAILGEGVLHVFAVNRSVDASIEVAVELAGASSLSLRSAELLHDDDPAASNTWDQPDRVRRDGFEPSGGSSEPRATLVLPPMSFVAATFEVS